MKPLQAATVVDLEVVREAPFGYFLSDGTQELLLHETETTGTLNEGQTVKVFLYRDKTGRLAATMTIPVVVIGSYAWLSVVEVKKNLGVFLDIGIKKDILLSKDDLPARFSQWPVVGDKLYCTLTTDKKNRLLAQPAEEDKIAEISHPASESLFNKQITGTVYRLIDTGASFISDEGIRGFIHESEQKEEQRLGGRITGRVIHVKEDGTVNGSLLPRKHERIDEDAEMLFTYLLNRGGSMPYTDKTHPDDIKKLFDMSKGSFKRALGKLMKEKKVYQKDGWTRISE